MSILRAIGLMSGTSMDGVDVALIETDGEGVVRHGPTAFRPYDERDRALLRQAMAEGAHLTDRHERAGAVGEAEAAITDRHARAVQEFISSHNITVNNIDIIGFHGQTILHRPDRRLTIQIGNGHDLAVATAIPVAFDFRAEDVAAGGQGAPLVPIYHRALVDSADLSGPTAVVNIGGVANITWIVPGAEPVACDTGPGNALLDDLMLARTGEGIDRDGATSASGIVDEPLLGALIAHPFFQKLPPKSLDRNEFSIDGTRALSTPDAARTLAAFTAESIARALKLMPAMAMRIVVCGGGARNPTIMLELHERSGLDVRPAEAFGWSSDAMEAQAFAYLAVRTLKGLPLTFPSTTGAPRAMTGGIIRRP